MKKLIPIVVLVLGLMVVGFAVWKVVLSKPATPSVTEEEEPAVELPFEKRPFLTLTPREDGHEVKLTVSRILTGTPSLEYEMTYKVSDGRTLGVPGSVKLDGKTEIERDLLFGSCSSGKCRYDEGVETGTASVKLRDDKGKMLGKATTDFKLQQGGSGITFDGFSFTGKLDSKAFYMAYGTLGMPQQMSGAVVAGPFGVSSKSTVKVSGEVAVSGDGIGDASEMWMWDGSKWSKLGGTVSGNKISVKVTSLGVFAVVNSAAVAN